MLSSRSFFWRSQCFGRSPRRPTTTTTTTTTVISTPMTMTMRNQDAPVPSSRMALFSVDVRILTPHKSVHHHRCGVCRVSVLVLCPQAPPAVPARYAALHLCDPRLTWRRAAAEGGQSGGGRGWVCSARLARGYGTKAGPSPSSHIITAPRRYPPQQQQQYPGAYPPQGYMPQQYPAPYPPQQYPGQYPPQPYPYGYPGTMPPPPQYTPMDEKPAYPPQPYAYPGMHGVVCLWLCPRCVVFLFFISHVYAGTMHSNPTARMHMIALSLSVLTSAEVSGVTSSETNVDQGT